MQTQKNDVSQDGVALMVDNVYKKYGEHRALAGLSFSVERGEVCGLLGPNGAGKSTLMQCVTTLLRQDTGGIRVFGADTLTQARRARASLGYVAQASALDKTLTGREHLKLHAALYHVPRKETDAAIGRVLTLVGLEEPADRRVKTYSGGMARRLDLATALLHDPALLILDEPTVGLDIHTRGAIWSFIRRLASAGTAVLIATHHTEEAEYLSDRLVIVDHGKVIAEGSSEDLKKRFGKGVVHVKTGPFVSDEELLKQATLLRDKGVSQMVLTDTNEGGRLLIAVEDADGATEELRKRLADALQVSPAAFHAFGFEQPGLEDVFLAATGHTLRDAAWTQTDTPPPGRRRQNG